MYAYGKHCKVGMYVRVAVHSQLLHPVNMQHSGDTISLAMQLLFVAKC